MADATASGRASPIARFLGEDHRRLEALLDRATADPERFDGEAYAEFREGLLRHIGMEERILLPAAQKRRGGEPLPGADRLRLQHGAIAALLVPTPTPDVVATIRHLLAAHNPLEEGPGAIYEAAEEALGDEVGAVVERLRAAPRVPVSPFADGAKVLAATRRALERAGFDPASLPLERVE